jgi:thiamine biosynthesis lipoprotein
MTADRTSVAMGTFVTIDTPPGFDAAVDRAFGWFREIEARCSRFDAASELTQLSQRVGEAVPVSPIVFEAVRFALAVAEDTDGAFDPTVGAAMAARGFDRNYRTGERVAGSTSRGSNAPRNPAYEPTDVGRVPPSTQSTRGGPGVSYRDVEVDVDRQTITLLRPLMLDLGAVAKGLAIDMAARELDACPWYAIDAGGDVFVGGSRPDAGPWTVGIRHPRVPDRLLATIRLTGGAVCTSGDYERVTTAGHHILDPRQRAAGSGQGAENLRALPTAYCLLPAASRSASVIAPNAMLADALATAAFVLGGTDGIRLLERHGVEGLIVSADGDCYATAGFDRTHTILQDAQGTAHDHPGAAARHRDPDSGVGDRRAGSR